MVTTVNWAGSTKAYSALSSVGWCTLLFSSSGYSTPSFDQAVMMPSMTNSLSAADARVQCVPYGHESSSTVHQMLCAPATDHSAGWLSGSHFSQVSVAYFWLSYVYNVSQK